MNYLSLDKQFEYLIGDIAKTCKDYIHNANFMDKFIDKLALEFKWDIKTREEFAHSFYQWRHSCPAK